MLFLKIQKYVLPDLTVRRLKGLHYLTIHFPELQTGNVSGQTNPQVPQF